MKKKFNIVWIPPTKNKNSASFRLRVVEIMAGLRELGHTCNFYENKCFADILIISKKYNFEVIQAIKLFRATNPHGVIVFDLCDNHFYSDLKDQKQILKYTERIQMLKSVVKMVDIVTTSSDYLVGVVAERCDIDRDKIFAIQDCYETNKISLRVRNCFDFIAEIQYKWLAWRLNRTNNLEDRFVWFGTHGVSYAEGGMVDLLEQRTVINNALRDSTRSLTIISNSYRKYLQVARSLGVRTYYLPWHQNTVYRALHLHSVLILPIKQTPFTFSKSANRPITGIFNGLLVVCDLIPSYEKMREFLISPVNTSSLALAVSLSKEERVIRTDAALSYLHHQYSLINIANKWEAVLIDIWRYKKYTKEIT